MAFGVDCAEYVGVTLGTLEATTRRRAEFPQHQSLSGFFQRQGELSRNGLNDANSDAKRLPVAVSSTRRSPKA